jgi:undecaprenyl-diphosphatase
VTEFLPVSSSAHLVIYNKFVVGLESSLSLDIAMHIGSLLAAVSLVTSPLKNSIHVLYEKNGLKNSVFLITVATLPLVLIAFFLEYARLISFSRQLEIIVVTNIVFALLMLISDRKANQRKLSDISIKDVLFIGFWQSFAVLPGASRSGSTITGARFLKFNREDAIIISVILSIPSIALSSAYVAFKLFSNTSKIELEFTFYATLLSFIFSFLALKLFIKLGQSFSFTPFVVYRILLGFVLAVILFI